MAQSDPNAADYVGFVARQGTSVPWAVWRIPTRRILAWYALLDGQGKAQPGLWVIVDDLGRLELDLDSSRAVARKLGIERD